MRINIKAALLVGCSLVFVGTALSGEGVEVKITNDGTEDIVVTVYDMNTSPERVVLANAHINGFTSVPITLTADANGKASLSWTAPSADAAFPKCGHADAVVSGEAPVNVHADSSCSV